MLTDPLRLAQRWGRRFAAPISRSKAGRPSKVFVGQRAKTDAQASQMLVDVRAFADMDYRIARIAAADFPVMDNRLVEFTKAFQKLLGEYQFPLVAYEVGPWHVRFYHYKRHWDLTNREWRCVARVGFEAARIAHCKMVWCGSLDGEYDPSRWVLLNPGEFEPWRGRHGATEAEYKRVHEIVNASQLRVDAMMSKCGSPKEGFWSDDK